VQILYQLQKAFSVVNNVSFGVMMVKKEAHYV